VEVTAQVVDVQAAHVVPPKTWLTLLDGVPSIIGIKTVVIVLSHMKVEEMLMLCFTTQIIPSMSDSGKLIKAIGVHAVEEVLHVMFKPT
jgi:hypothetical protein